MLTLFISEDAGKFLEKIPHKHAQQIVGKLDKLAQDPESVPSLQLSGFPHLRRAKSGEYRMIYRINGEFLELQILRIGKRNDGEVYRNLENLD
jgi:mRNA interferase RelE/StbE